MRLLGIAGNVTEVSVAPNEAAQTGRQETEIATAMVPMQSKSNRVLPVVNAEKEITALRRTFEKNMRVRTRPKRRGNSSC